MVKSSVSRENIKINNKIFSIISLTFDDLKSDDVLSLIKMNRGKVLDTKYSFVNEYIGDYLYNFKFYFKKAILSNICNSLHSMDKNINYIIEDYDFYQYSEYYKLAKGVRSLSIICEKNNSFSEFSHNCFYDYGLVVNNNSEKNCNSFYINLNKIDGNGKAVFYYKLNSGIIYPDPQYFKWNDDIRKLTDAGVSFECACSVFSSN